MNYSIRSKTTGSKTHGFCGFLLFGGGDGGAAAGCMAGTGPGFRCS